MASDNNNDGPKIKSNVLCFPGKSIELEDSTEDDMALIRRTREEIDRALIDMMLRDGFITEKDLMMWDQDSGRRLIMCTESGEPMTAVQLSKRYYIDLIIGLDN